MGIVSVNIGDRFSRLKIKQCLGRNSYGKLHWLCECDCGGTAKVVTQKLKNGHTKSCGCLSREVARANRIAEASHGHSRLGKVSRTYSTWRGMIKRCHKIDDKDYENYGGRGIEVCERWHKFENFLTDMGERPENRTIGRIDNDRGYYKENCQWETHYQQSINTRATKLTERQVAEIREDSRVQLEIAKSFGISQSHVSLIKLGKARNG